MAVAILRHIAGPDDVKAKAELMAKQLHDSWGVGDACGSGVLMLFAIGDRQVLRAAEQQSRCTAAFSNRL